MLILLLDIELEYKFNMCPCSCSMKCNVCMFKGNDKCKKNLPLSVRAGCTQRCHVLQQRLSESALILCGRQSVPLRGRVVVCLSVCAAILH